MPRGIVKWFNDKRGFGFILGSSDGPDVFVHYSSIEGNGFRTLRDGEEVEYEVVGESGKGLQARSVRRINATTHTT